jgi:hypothetical protein
MSNYLLFIVDCGAAAGAVSFPKVDLARKLQLPRQVPVKIVISQPEGEKLKDLQANLWLADNQQ